MRERARRLARWDEGRRVIEAAPGGKSETFLLRVVNLGDGELVLLEPAELGVEVLAEDQEALAVELESGGGVLELTQSLLVFRRAQVHEILVGVGVFEVDLGAYQLRVETKKCGVLTEDESAVLSECLLGLLVIEDLLFAEEGAGGDPEVAELSLLVLDGDLDLSAPDKVDVVNDLALRKNLLALQVV